MASNYFSWLDKDVEVPTFQEDEETGLMAGFTSNASRIGSSMSGSLNKGFGGAFSSAHQLYEDMSIPSSTWATFFIILGLGVFFIFLSSFALPFIVLAPHKFAVLFTFGSLFILGSIVYLRGWERFKGTVDGDPTMKKIFWQYCISMFATLFFTLWYTSYIFTLVSVVFQLISLLYFVFSFIPGGKAVLDTVFGGCMRCCCPSWAQSSSTPSATNRGMIGRGYNKGWY